MKTMNKVFWTCGTILALTGTAHAEDEVTAFSTTETVTELVYGNPGILPCAPGYELLSLKGDECWHEETREVRLPHVIIDATDGKSTFPLEESMREFADEKEFLAFVEERLNGKAVYDEQGEIVAVEGMSIELGKAATSDGFTQQVELVADPIAAFLGGKAGAFKIGEDIFTLPSQRDLQASMELSIASGSLPSSGTKCNSAGTDCIRGESFITHAVAYHSAGSTTKQTVGGYREWHYFCWKGPIPWSCTGHSGSNRLYAASAVFYPAYNGEPALLGTFQANKANTTEVTAKAWQVGIKGQVANASGVCSTHSSEGTTGALATGTGRYDGGRCSGSY